MVDAHSEGRRAARPAAQSPTLCYSSPFLVHGGPHSCQTSSKAASNSVPLLPSQPPAFTAMASQAGLVWGGLGDWMRKGVSHAQRLHQMHKARVVMRAVGTPAGNIRASVANDGSREGGGGTVEGAMGCVGSVPLGCQEMLGSTITMNRDILVCVVGSSRNVWGTDQDEWGCFALWIPLQMAH
eukprot:scaffold34644_cov25-Tisochrysis_lutea.AAC.1